MVGKPGLSFKIRYWHESDHPDAGNSVRCRTNADDRHARRFGIMA